MLKKFIINSLLYNDDLWNLRVVGRIDDYDVISLDFKNLRFDKITMINLIKSDCSILAPTISIDARLLQDDDIVDALNSKSDTTVIRVRIVNDNYKLNEYDYNRLSFADYIYVDDVEHFNYDLFRIFKSDGIYKHQFEMIDNNGDTEYKDVFHVVNKLSDKELKRLVVDANNCINSEIVLDLYDPSYYNDFLTKLSDNYLNQDVNVTLLSNILVDSKKMFDELVEYNYTIKIKYSSNHEVLNYYMNEPFDNVVNYDNQLEINGSCTLKDYCNILNIIYSGSDYLRDKYYSPLESIIWTYRFIKESDVDIDSSELFSAILRRHGERVFRYSSLGNNKNILRIVDKKYNIDNISIVDFNINVDEYKFSDNNYLYSPNIDSEFCNFLYSPRDLLKTCRSEEVLSISNSLVIDRDDYDLYRYNSCDNIEMFFNYNYDNRGNTFRFLELVGLKEEFDTAYDLNNLYDYIDYINDMRCTDSIDDNIMLEAIINVERHENPSIDESDIERIKKSFDRANDIRDNDILTEDYHIITNYEIIEEGELIYNVDIEEVSLVPLGDKEDEFLTEEEDKKDEVISVVEDVETLDDFIVGTDVKRPRDIKPGESMEEYNAYYRTYFNKYLLPVLNSNNNKEEEFIIEEKKKDYRDLDKEILNIIDRIDNRLLKKEST